MRSRWTRALMAAAAGLALALEAGSPALAQKAPGVDWTAGVVSAVGSGVPPAGKPAAQARLMARRAAQADAYRQLAEAIQGVQVTSETRVVNFETESDEIRTQVSALVKGAKIVAENVTADGAYEVRLELPMYGANSLAAVVFNSSLLRRQAGAAQPGGETAGGETAGGEGPPDTPASAYTGLVVDARGLGAKAAMMPAIFDEQGQELYMGGIQVSNDDLVAAGPVTYVKSLDDAKKSPRVGPTPLIVRAKRFKGPFHADLVVPADEGKRVVQASKSSDFLKKLAVVVVI